MDSITLTIERNIVKEIMRECYPRKVRTNENFVAYLVKLLLLDPNWGITDPFVTREKVCKFVDYVIDHLAAQNDPKIVTLQMQFYFTCSLENIDNVLKRTRKDILDRLLPLKNDIFETVELKNQEEIDLYIKKIVCYITLVSGLGNPKEEFVYMEAATAFKSVMNEEELKEFAASSKKEKELQLVQLTNVVSGIRLFNKDCEKGGSGIEELPVLLETAVRSIKEELQNSLLTIMEKVNLLTTIADRSYEQQQEVEGEEKGKYKMVCTLPTDIEEIYMESIKDLLVFYRQYELFLRKIIEDLDKIEETGANIHENFHEILQKIHDSVYMRIAVPSKIVFPLFESLAGTWIGLQDQVVILTKYSQIAINLEVYCKNTYFNKELFESFIEDSVSLTDAERLEETSSLMIRSDNPEIKIFAPEYLKDYDKIRLQYLGFCCWKLVETDGALIPGNPSMGMANYRNMNFVFSTPEACDEFSKKPNHYIMKILEMARRKPQLINLLFLKGQLEKVKELAQLTEVKVIVTMTENKLIETVDFQEIMPTNIDRTYFWNIWDYKRQALLLANLSKCKTVSTQTLKTHSKNAIKSQTYEMRTKDQQTMIDNYSNVPKPSNFIYGLRGRKDNEQFIIDLTRPVEE